MEGTCGQKQGLALMMRFGSAPALRSAATVSGLQAAAAMLRGDTSSEGSLGSAVEMAEDLQLVLCRWPLFQGCKQLPPCSEETLVMSVVGVCSRNGRGSAISTLKVATVSRLQCKQLPPCSEETLVIRGRWGLRSKWQRKCN